MGRRSEEGESRPSLRPQSTFNSQRGSAQVRGEEEEEEEEEGMDLAFLLMHF